MLRLTLTLALFITGFAAMAKPVCVGGVCYPDEATARAAGVVLPGEAARPKSAPYRPSMADVGGRRRRLAMGYMPAPEFVAFLRDEPSSSRRLEDHALWMVLLLVLVGGLAANLTPCVLPLVPVNLIIIGSGWKRGVAYAAGITTTYGLLGLAAAFGGLAFGTLQSSAGFNFAVAAVFVILALAMLGAFSIPAIRFRIFGRGGKALPRAGSNGNGAPAPSDAAKKSLLKPYLLGLGSATLASACVEPILIATLLLTAKWFAAGRVWAVALPFVLGAGMGVPYPFAAAGFSVLPKPGAWMVWVKRAFALVFFAMAAWYGTVGVKAIKITKDIKDIKDIKDVKTEDLPAGKLLIKVGAPWCRNCKAMERKVFTVPEVEEALTHFDEVRALEIDTFDDLSAYPVLKGLDIKGLPAYVVIE